MAIFDENTKSGAVMAAIDYSKSLERAFEQAAAHPDMTEDLAEILSKRYFQIEYELHQDLRRPGDE